MPASSVRRGDLSVCAGSVLFAILWACAGTHGPSDVHGADDTNHASPASDVSRVADWRARLSNMGVDGASVGYGGEPGQFFLLLQEIKFDVQPAEIEALLRDELPQARALALVLLATRSKPDARTVEANVCDDGPISLMANGCLNFRTTVGRFARDLLADPHLLNSCLLCSPLRQPAELWRLDWELLSRDDCPGIVGGFVPDLQAPGARPGGDLFAELARALPAVPRWRLVRTIGRRGVLRYGDKENRRQTREWLEGIVQDAGEPPEARLAAASALTHLGNAATLAILAAQAASLDEFADGGHGTRMHDTLKRHLSFTDRIRASRKATTAEELRRLAPELIATFREFEGEPFVFDELTDTYGYAFGDQKDTVLHTLDDGLAMLEQRAQVGFPAWSTEFDLAARIARFRSRSSF